MSATFTQLFGGSGGGSLTTYWTRSLFASATINFPVAGRLRMSFVGAGGSGAAKGGSLQGGATGGNSAPWGRKTIDIKAGDILVWEAGAGGLPSGATVASTVVQGNSGSTSLIKLNGTTIVTIGGGEGGFADGSNGTTTVPANPVVSTITGADHWVSGRKAGDLTGGGTTGAGVSGGAGVDLLETGGGSSLTQAKTASVATGAGMSAATTLNRFPPFNYLAVNQWGFATFTTTDGSTGVGSSTSEAAGAFAGGSGGTSTSNRGAPGIGGGSGGMTATSSNGSNGSLAGGNSYMYIEFIAEV